MKYPSGRSKCGVPHGILCIIRDNLGTNHEDPQEGFDFAGKAILSLGSTGQ